MARAKSRPVPAETEGINTEAAAQLLAQGRAAARELAVIDGERLARAKEAADLVGYSGVLTPEVAESLVSSGLQRTAEGVWLMGAGLLMLKELTEHGEFGRRVEALGLNLETAKRRMVAVRKFSKSVAGDTFRNAVSSASKLLELASLDQDEINHLADGGAINGVTLDKVETMTRRELREALREREAELEHANAKRDAQSKRIDKLEAERRRYNKLPPAEQLQEMQRCALAMMNDIRGGIAGGLRSAVAEIGNHGEERGLHDLFLGGLVAQIRHELDQLVQDFGLPDVAPGQLPDWLADDQVAQAAAAGKTRKAGK